MRQVDVTAVLDAPRATVEAALSPRSIVEYAGTYDVESVSETPDGTVVTARSDQLEIVLDFRELDDGYVSHQRDGTGPFEELHTRLTVRAIDEGTRVTARSEFTFGGTFAFLKDRFAGTHRQHELERLVANLAYDLNDSNESSGETRSGDDSTETGSTDDSTGTDADPADVDSR